MREYQRELRKKRKRLELSLSTEEYHRLERTAKHHDLKVATFARDAIFAYLDERYLVTDPERVAELELALRGIATDINRVARSLNRRSASKAFDTAHINERLAELEEAVTGALREPTNLVDLVATRAASDSTFADRLRDVLGSRLREGGGSE